MNMNFRTKVFINTFGNVFLFGMQWLISIAIVRISGYNDAGIFAIAMTISNIFSCIGNYSIRNYQLVNASDKSITQVDYLSTRIFTTVLTTVVCIVFCFIIPKYTSVEKYAIILYLIYSNANNISDIMMGTVQLCDDLQKNGISNIIRGTLCFASFTIVQLLTNNIVYSLAIMAASSAAVLILYDLRVYISDLRSLSEKKRINISSLKIILKNCFFLMISGLFPMVTTAVPRNTLRFEMGEEILGMYASIFTPTVIMTTLIPTILLSVTPKFSEYLNGKNKKKFQKLTFQCYGICTAIIIIAEIAAVTVGKFFMAIIFGEEILEYYPLIYIAIITTGLNSLISCGFTLLIALRRNKTIAVSAFSAMLIAALFSGIFIRHFGIYGAAYILIASYSVQIFIQLAVIIPETKRAFNSPADTKTNT